MSTESCYFSKNIKQLKMFSKNVNKQLRFFLKCQQRAFKYVNKPLFKRELRSRASRNLILFFQKCKQTGHGPRVRYIRPCLRSSPVKLLTSSLWTFWWNILRNPQNCPELGKLQLLANGIIKDFLVTSSMSDSAQKDSLKIWRKNGRLQFYWMDFAKLSGIMPEIIFRYT